jgi:membrane-associated phospholipid phosphatase
MLTPRRLTFCVALLTLVVAFFTWQVVSFEWFAQADYRAVEAARRLVPDKGVFRFTVNFGLRGLMLTVFLPLLSWVSWRRRSWAPLAGFLIVLVFETGMTGAMKLAVGRELPWQSWPLMGRLETGELGYPSGHATNVPALIGYVVWFFTAPGSFKRRLGWGLVASLVVLVNLSSWLIRTHWPTDLYAGTAIGLIALLTIIAFMNASGLSPWATSRRATEVHP